MASPPVALFDKNTDHVAWWIGDHIFTLDLKWIAFVSGGNAFSAAISPMWLGPAKDGVVMDRTGRVIFFAADAHVSGHLSPYKPFTASRPPRPERPPRPNKPPRPYKPARPSEGWSAHSPRTWYAGGDPPAAEPAAPTDDEETKPRPPEK